MRPRGTAFIATALVLALATPAAAVTRRVDDDGEDCPTAGYTSIQAAVDASGPGDLVVVCDGTYRETVSIGDGKDGLSLRAENLGDAKLVHPSATLPGFSSVINIDRASNVLVKGLVISGPIPVACGDRGAGISIGNASNAAITDNRLIKMRRRPVNSCGLIDRISAIQVFGGSVAIQRNTILGVDGIGIDVISSVVDIATNTVRAVDADIDFATGISTLFSTRGSIVGNDVRGFDGPNATGISAFLLPGSAIRHNIMRDNDRGLFLGTVQGTLVESNRPRFNRIGLFASNSTGGNTIRVNDVRSNEESDCVDGSSGAGTAGTANTWSGNRGPRNPFPAGICGH
ncbi:MAG TPA: right-handed parallel beta-helix repeat-containing protein [Acidimicrobiales bacterium]